MPEVFASAVVSDEFCWGLLFVFDEDEDDSVCFEEVFLPFSAMSAALVDARRVSRSICGESPLPDVLFCFRISFA